MSLHVDVMNYLDKHQRDFSGEVNFCVTYLNGIEFAIKVISFSKQVKMCAFFYFTKQGTQMNSDAADKYSDIRRKLNVVYFKIKDSRQLN